MRFALYFLILTLPFVAQPRLVGEVKLSDFGFLLLIFCALMSGRLKITWQILLLIVFVAVFAAYGWYRINHIETITVLQGWDVGLLSQQRYQLVAAGQTILYILGASVFGRYMLHPKSGLLRFLLWFFILWSVVCLLSYFAANSFSLGRVFDPSQYYFTATFPEKGTNALFVVFVYALLITCSDLPGTRKFKRAEIGILVGISLIDLFFAKADGGTFLFFVFNICYFLGRRPKMALKLAPVALLVVLAMFPLYGRVIDKANMYTATFGGKLPMTNGRYAAILLTPSIFMDSPFFGVGYGNFIFYRTSQQYGPDLLVVPKDEPDNTYLQILLECGSVGLIVFLVLMLYVPGRLMRRERAYSVWPYFATFVVLLQRGTTFYFLDWMWLFTLMAVIKALGWTARARLQPSAPALESPLAVEAVAA